MAILQGNHLNIGEQKSLTKTLSPILKERDTLDYFTLSY